MTSLLLPAYELKLGSQILTRQAIEIRAVSACAPLLDVLSVRLPSAFPLSAAPGDPAALTLNGGEGGATAFTGEIASVRRAFDEIHVTAMNAGGALSRYRPAATYEQATAGTVIRTLARDAGARTGRVEIGPDLAFYVADPARTAWEHVARLAAWGGAAAYVSSRNEIRTGVASATQADVALKYGREILAIEASHDASATDRWVVAGEGGAGAASAPTALRPTTDFFAGNRPDRPGLGKRWRFEPALRTVRAAAAAGAALKRQYDASRVAGRVRTLLQPKLHSGSVLHLQDVPGGLVGGPVWLSRVEHVLGEYGGVTSACFHQGGAGSDPQALLGSLAGAVGGFL